MKRIVFLSFLVLPVTATAQQGTVSLQGRAGTDSLVFHRARQLVLEGNGAAGRALVDSMVVATTGRPSHVDALYWRGALASTASDAERDYRRIIVEHASSMRAADALLGLAQLEMTRGDREGAIEHLQRFLLENASHPERGRAGVWLARLLIEQGRLPRGCMVLTRARSTLPAEAIELRNQLDYYGQRCTGVDTTERRAVSVASAPTRDTARPSAPTRDTTRPSTPPRTDTTKPSSPPAAPARPPARTDSTPRAAPARTDTARPTAGRADVSQTPAAVPADTMRRQAPRDTMRPVTTTRSTGASTPSAAPAAPSASARATPATAGRAPAPVPAAPAPAATAARYTVQVAAFDTRPEADQLAARLKQRGLDVRVFGAQKPFRVRIGRYAAQAEATQLLRTLRGQGMNGFVTVAEPEPR